MRRRECIDIFSAALKAADPFEAVKNVLRREKDRIAVSGRLYDLKAVNRIFVVGAGKGASLMARAAEEVLDERLDRGLIIVPYGHTALLRKIDQREASHPLPDEAGIRATRELIDIAQTAGQNDFVVCLLSGGASSLMVSPVDGITLLDKKETTQLLLKSGATIDELNTVRKHLSKVKGGRLARIAFPATLVTLVLSDVIGDPLDIIASGPTVPDSSTFPAALAVVEKYDLRRKLPERAALFLERGAAGLEPESPKEEDVSFQKTFTTVIGGLRQSLTAAKQAAQRLGFETRIITAELSGEARSSGRYLARMALEAKRSAGEKRPVCLMSGGETTVTVRGSGMGGRNQELALAFAEAIEGERGITMLSAGTDGTDGPTDAAGAVVDGETAAKARTAGLDPRVFLENNDSYRFFQILDAKTGEKHHLHTGPTGTNVMDIQIILIEAGRTSLH